MIADLKPYPAIQGLRRAVAGGSTGALADSAANLGTSVLGRFFKKATGREQIRTKCRTVLPCDQAYGDLYTRIHGVP